VVERRRLRRQWEACTTPADILAFSRKYLSPGQRPDEILGFASFARTVAPQVLCEIGTLHGGTHLFLSHALPTVHTTIALDRQVRNKGKLRLLQKPGQRLVFLNGLSQSPETAGRVASIVGGTPIDLLFIDGDHAYESVRSDFLMYRTLVRDGGLIAFHDICDDYLTLFGRHTGHFAGGAPRLWRKIRESYPHREFVDSPDQDAFGIGVIVHSAALPADL
jgi:cephalosporin hydroxylase